MRFEKVAENGYMIRLDAGEEIMEYLKKFSIKNRIKSCWFSGIGAVRKAELAYYDLKKKEYETRKLAGDFEVVSLSGNISWLGSEPVIHAHIVLSGRDMKTHSGHLMRAHVSATLEIFATCFAKKLGRGKDKETRLNLLHLIDF